MSADALPQPALAIWKYTLQLTDAQELVMPTGAQILSVQTQHGAPRLWALVDAAAVKEQRRILIIGTGNRVPDDLGVFIGTFQLSADVLEAAAAARAERGQVVVSTERSQ